ncbi:unnamed protein product [Caenorhabditis nigoni]
MISSPESFPTSSPSPSCPTPSSPLAKDNFMFKCRGSPDPVRWSALADAKPMMQFSLRLRRDDVLPMTMLTSSLCSFY